MKDERFFKVGVLIALVVSILSLTIGYALYNETLTISGTINAAGTASTWDVHFEGTNGSTTTLTAPTLAGSATVATQPTLAATSISGFKVNFFAPGDSVTYNFQVANDGDLDAVLTTATIGSISCAPATGSTASQTEATSLCGQLTYALTYADGSAITTGATSKITASGTKAMKLSVTWNSTSTLRISDDITVSIGTTTLVYTQS